MGCGASDSQLEAVDLPGRDLYLKKELIGVGNHATVYRCIHQLNNQERAIKSISQLNFLSSSSFSGKNYSQTLALYKSLQHPRVATYEYAELTGKELSVVMEIAKEGTLRKHIHKQGKLSEEAVSSYLKQILEGLLYLHNNSILHKDLKTTNVLLFAEGTLKVADYGFAELYDPKLLAREGASREAKKSS
jgi:serine/threonine protein kinase